MATVVQGDASVYWDSAWRIATGHVVDSKPFFTIPLYTIFLGFVRSLGGGLISVYAIQTLMHLLTAAMIAWLAAKKMNNLAGFLAFAVFMLLEDPAFYATRLLPGTLQLLLVASILVFAHRMRGPTKTYGSITLGLFVGLLALSYPPAVLLVPLLPLFIVSCSRLRGSHLTVATKTGAKSETIPNIKSPLKPYVAGIVAMAASLAAIAPVTILNWMACREFIPISAHAGITFSQGNTDRADGVYTPIDGISARREKMHDDAARVYAQQFGQAGSYGAIDRYFLRRGWGYLMSDPGRATWLVARKAYWFLTGRHYSDLYYPTLERQDGFYRSLYLAPIPTAWLMILALFGLCSGWTRSSLSWVELALVILPFVVVLLFWFSPRYRLPAVPVLVLASVAAIEESIRTIIPGRRRSNEQSRVSNAIPIATAFCLIAAMGFQYVNSLTGFDNREAYRPQYEYNLGWLFLEQRDFETALRHFVRSDHLDADRPHVLTALTTAYAQLGRQNDADRSALRLVNADPQSPATWNTVGGLHLRFGQWTIAQEAFLRSLALDPRSAEAHLGVWVALSAQGRAEQGLGHLIRSVALDEANPLAACEYGLWLAQHAPPLEAHKQLSRCLELSPDSINRPDIRGAWGTVSGRLGPPDTPPQQFGVPAIRP